MAHAHSRTIAVDVPATLSQSARPRAKVVPLRAPRAWLDIRLDARTHDAARAHLAALYQSPLGIYVVQTALTRETLCVRFDIAPEDFAFTLHTLMNCVPEATIGALRPRQDAKDC
ncbi:conserved hypothetical protein [Paraburkholderia tropica]|nr:conserved hypothetical protein [Paraburkholderia tropica]